MSTWTIYRRLFLLARPYWLHVAALFSLTLLAVPVTLLTPLPLKIAVDSAVGDEPLPRLLASLGNMVGGPPWRAALLLSVGLMILVTLVGQLQQASRALLNTFLSNRLLMHFRSELLAQVQRLSLSYHDTKGAGDTLYRIQYDATAIQSIVIEGAMPFVVSAATVASMLYVCMRIDTQLALVALSVTPVLAILVRYYQPRLRAMSNEVRKLDSSAMSVVQELLGAVRVVKVFGQEERERSRFDQHSGQGMNAKLRLARAERAMSMWVGMVIASGTALVLFAGVTHVREGSLTLGNLLLIMGYLGSLYTPLRSASGSVAKLQRHLSQAERAFELLDHEPDVKERPNARALATASGAIEFKDVSFAYPGGDAILRHVSFSVPAGSHVGVVGATGAGKTTLLNLLLRLYDPTEGMVLLDGVDIRDVRLADLRKQYSVVLQEPLLFSTSIAENIAYARADATAQEIVEAAKAANAHDFIVAMREGYETQVGDRGLRLSGGERQRISLARAFLRRAPILILDEPTSSVDSGTESLIIEAMQRLMHGRTTFMVAHRLSTLDSCDLVAHVGDGAVTITEKEQGSRIGELQAMVTG
jgi:ATP-binding cassette, subfamily B, bacterial